MKNIIVPIDFTDLSKNVVQYALEFAKPYRSNLFLIHTYQGLDKAAAVRNLDRILKQEYYANLQRMLDECDIPESVEIFTKIIEGKTLSVINRIADQLNADLVVVGSKSGDNKENLYLGPTAGTLVRHTNSPILIIPENYKFKPIASICLAVKSLKHTQILSFRPLDEIIDLYKPEVCILEVKTPEDIEIETNEFLITDHYSIEAKSIEAETIYKGLKNHLAGQSVDLICGIRRERGYFEKMLTFNASTSKDDMYLENPLLVLQGKK